MQTRPFVPPRPLPARQQNSVQPQSAVLSYSTSSTLLELISRTRLPLKPASPSSIGIFLIPIEPLKTSLYVPPIHTLSSPLPHPLPPTFGSIPDILFFLALQEHAQADQQVHLYVAVHHTISLFTVPPVTDYVTQMSLCPRSRCNHPRANSQPPSATRCRPHPRASLHRRTCEPSSHTTPRRVRCEHHPSFRGRAGTLRRRSRNGMGTRYAAAG